MSILEAVLIAGGRESREGRQTVFFTPLDPWRDEIEEKFPGGLSKPREVHYKTERKRAQDAVNWIQLTKGQETGGSRLERERVQWFVCPFDDSALAVILSKV